MQKIIQVQTFSKYSLTDITRQVIDVVQSGNTVTGIVNVYVQGATAAIMIQENWDNSVQDDVLNLLDKLIPEGAWQHDKQDNNGAAHLKAGVVGPSETIPIINCVPALSTWQNIFLCEFDGPRKSRSIVVTVINEE